MPIYHILSPNVIGPLVPELKIFKCFIESILVIWPSGSGGVLPYVDITVESKDILRIVLNIIGSFFYHCWSSVTFSIVKAYEPWHEISNNLVCATSKGSDQPAHTRSLIRAFASRLSIL